MLPTALVWYRGFQGIPHEDGLEIVIHQKPELVQRRVKVQINAEGHFSLEDVELRDVYQWRHVVRGTPATIVASWGRRPRLTALDKAGAARLEAPEEPLPKGKHYLRTYYTSEGGELLCYDEGPMHPATLEARRRALGSVKHTYWSTGPDFQKPTIDAKGARLVVLPSQRATIPTEE